MIISKLRKLFWLVEFKIRFMFSSKTPVIGLVVSSFVKGGLEQVVLDLYEGFQKRGISVYLLVEENILGELSQKIASEHIFVFNRNEREFISFCRTNGINTLHYHYNTYFIRGAALMGFRIIYTIHNIYTWKSNEEIESYAEKLKNANEIVAVSGFVKAYFCERTKISSNRVRVITNGISLKVEKPSCKITRSELGFLEDDFLLCFTASFHRVKHQLNMLNIMKRLENEYPKIKLLFLGGEGEGGYRRLVMDKVEKLGVHNIKFLDYLAHEEMHAFLKTVPDVFLLPTLQEGCSLAALEALCAGIPMLLTNTGAANEMITNNGIIVKTAYSSAIQLNEKTIQLLSEQMESDNSNELYQGIIKLYENYTEYSKAAAKLAQSCERYSASAMVDNYIKII